MPTHVHRTGSGLGLAIVAQTAALHGGSAAAASNDPHGLRVTLTLPELKQIGLEQVRMRGRQALDANSGQPGH